MERKTETNRAGDVGVWNEYMRELGSACQSSPAPCSGSGTVARVRIPAGPALIVGLALTASSYWYD